ncbi:MAG: SDR family oxidoreductase [Pseudomonadota bacterium]
MTSLAGQRIVITGAADGLGAAIARVFAIEGAELVLMDRDEHGLARVAAATGGDAVVVNLADADATKAAIAQAAERPVNALIHNAAILRPEPFPHVTLSTFRETVDVGIQAAFLLSKGVWQGMVAQGSGMLIFVSSQSGIRGFADETAYCAAKHGLEGLSKCLALEGAAHGILSCTITPGMAMRTPMSERNYPPELKKTWVEPERLAPGFARIITERDAALSGQRLNAWALSTGSAP